MSWLSKGIEKFTGASVAVKTLAVGLIVGLFMGGCVGCKVGQWTGQPSLDGVGEFGWINEPDAAKALVSTFARPFFGDAAKPLIEAGEDKDALIYKAFPKATGRPWRAHDQDGVGSCVGQGMSGAIEMLSAIEKATGESQEYHDISAATCYAFSREVAGILGRGDGSTGAGAAKAAMTLGNLSCQEAGDDNVNSDVGGKLCKSWGRSGVPDEKRALAKKHTVKTASLVRTPEEMRTAIINGYPCTVASSVGFQGRGGFKRDNDGFCYAGGTWAHQMFFAGYRADKKAFLCFQSWGANSPPGPRVLDQPEGTFWVTWEDAKRMINAGETFALSGFDGYKSQDLDWLVRAPERPGQFLARRPARALLEFPLAP